VNPRNLASGIAEWLAIREHLLSEFPDIDPATLRDSIDGETALLDVVAGLLTDALDDEYTCEAITMSIKDRQARRDRYELRAIRRREAALKIMQAIGERKLERPEFTASIRAVPPSVVVEDVAALGSYHLRPVKYEPDKARIKETLLAGVPVTGARLTNGGETLTVRVR
jgi:hypothetical protein